MNALGFAAQQSLVAVPEPSRDTLSARGADAVSWLNGLVTSDLGALAAGRGAYGLLLNKQGKVQTDLEVLWTPSGVLVGVAPGRGEAVREALDRYLVMEDVELGVAPGLAWLRLFGPAARSTAQAISTVAGVVATGSIDWLGLDDAAVVVEAAALDSVAAEVVHRAGGSALLAKREEWELLRVAQRFPLFGVDYGSDDNPHEASLDRRAVSFSKGCYLGQEVVCMQDMRGKVKRRLIALRLEAGAAPAVGAGVFSEAAAEPVGHVSSVALDGETPLVLARLKAPFFEGTATLRIGDRKAQIVAEPPRH